MTLGARIVAGYLLLIALLAAVAAYEVRLVRRVVDSNERLTAVRVAAISRGLELIDAFDLLREFTEKARVVDDPAYRIEIDRIRGEIGERLAELGALELAPRERRALAALERVWAGHRAGGGGAAAEGRAEVPLELRRGAEELLAAARRATDEEAAESRAIARRAGTVSLAAAALGFALAVVLAIAISGSVTRPLRQLGRATRELARGRFSFRVRPGGGGEIAALAEDFNEMSRRLSELDELKKDFLSHVSHELKAPLASMRETNSLLLEGLPGELNDKQRRLLDLNQGCGERLSGMIEDLLDLSRLEAGAVDYRFAATDLGDLARTALGELENLSREKEVRLDATLPPGPAVAVCDGGYVIQVLGNLLANAIKFGPPGSAVELALGRPEAAAPPPAQLAERLGRRPAPGWLFEIRDEGPGIPEEERERIFERFHRVRRGGREAPGTGLGLAIAKQIVDAHGGALWVESGGGGSSFFVVLWERPAARPGPLSGPAAEDETLDVTTPAPG